VAVPETSLAASGGCLHAGGGAERGRSRLLHVSGHRELGGLTHLVGADGRERHTRLSVIENAVATRDHERRDDTDRVKDTGFAWLESAAADSLTNLARTPGERALFCFNVRS